MNKDRRKQIDEALALLERAQGLIEEIHDDESEAYEGLPESLQNGDRGQVMQEAIDNLSEARDGLDDLMDRLRDAAQ